MKDEEIFRNERETKQEQDSGGMSQGMIKNKYALEVSIIVKYERSTSPTCSKNYHFVQVMQNK